MTVGNLRKGILAFASVTALVLVLAACGSSSSTSSGTHATSTSTAASAGAGKKTPPKETIGYVDIAATVGIQPQNYHVFQQGAAALGWKVILEDANGNPTKALQAVQVLISEHVNAIVFAAVPAEYVHAGLIAAKAAHIPTIQIETQTAPNSYTAQYIFKDTVAGQAPLIEALRRNVPAHSQVAIETIAAISQYGTIEAALHTVLKAAGYPIVANVDVGLAPNESQLYQKESAAIVEAHPDLKAIIDIYGFVSDDAIGMKAAHAGPGLGIYSYNVTSQGVPTLLQKNSPLKALIWRNFAGTAALALNQLLNHFGTGAALAPSLSLSDSKLYTAANLPAALKSNPSSDANPIPPSTTLAPYLANWGKTYALKTASSS